MAVTSEQHMRTEKAEKDDRQALDWTPTNLTIINHTCKPKGRIVLAYSLPQSRARPTHL